MAAIYAKVERKNSRFIGGDLLDNQKDQFSNFNTPT